MERLVEIPNEELIGEANAKLRAQLGRLHDALQGRQAFSLDDIAAISAPIGRMAAVVSRATESGAPELDSGLKAYAETLGELQIALEQTRFMLLARSSQLSAARDHAEKLNLWAEAVKQTQ